MKWGVTEREELEVLRQYIPWVFGHGQDMLYVGANQIRPPHHARTFVAEGWRLHLLEVWLSNIEHYRGQALFSTFIWGDVCFQQLPPGSFDIVFWWHGPEHIDRRNLTNTLDRLEEIAPTIVLGCPHGHSPQEAVYGNHYEEHRWDVEPEGLERYGYTVYAYECVGRRHLLAWK